MKHLKVTNSWLVLFLSLSLIQSCKKVKKVEQAAKPNIVYILTDQWRASATGYAGNPDVKTPNLDAFAQDAVNFKNAVSVTPVCTPHRAALLTGRYPTTTGMFLNDLYLPDEELCMAEIFNSKGYNTGYLGKWHLDGHGRLNNVAPERRQGFDYWKALECSHNYTKMPYYDNNDPEIKYWKEYSPYAIAKDANQYLSNHAKGKEPFLLFLSIATPHYPHESAPREMKQLYPLNALTIAPNVPEALEEKTRKELQGYYAHCTATDKAIGMVLDKIKALSLMENTIIVFSSDHGEMMGAHGVKPFTKQLAWDESIRVPFLIRYPSIGNNKGTTVHAPINTPDILPSLLGLAKVKIPETIEGEDLSELIKNPDPSRDRAALVMGISPFGANFRDPEYRAIRTKQYTYALTPKGARKLFDNIKDPYQMENLLDKPEFSAIQQELDLKINKELDRIGDTFETRDYYMKKWNYVLDKSRNAINWWSFQEGDGVVTTPSKDK